MSTAYGWAPSLLDTYGAAVGPGDSKAQVLLQRWNELLQQRTLYDHVWQDQVELMLPGAADITRYRTPGAPRTERLFDTTVILAAQTLAANLMGAVTNQAITWAKLSFRNSQLKDNQAVSLWLATCDEIMMAAYNASNFYQAAHTFYLNLAIFGTAAMYVGAVERLDRAGQEEVYLRFQTLSTGRYCIAETSEGKVDTVFREFALTPRQARQKFGEVALSKALRDQGAMPLEMDRPKRFVHCVYPRGDVETGRLGNRNMPFAETYIEVDTRHVCWEGGYEEFPFLVSRWEQVGDGPWGFGPGHMALPDVKTLNTLRELMLLQLQLWVLPPLTALEEAVIGAISLESLAVNTITQADALKPLDLSGRPDLVKLEEATLQQAIRDLFFADALTGLPPVDATTMTAFEVAQRIEQMQRLMGPAFTRLLSEMLDPLADRVFGILWRGGVLPPVPRDVVLAAQANQGQLDVEYEGPLARAQRGVEVKAISETLAVATQMVGLTQRLDVLDNLDLDAMLRTVCEANGTPRELLLDTAQVAQVRAAREEQQQARAAQAAQAQQAENLGKVAPAVQAFQQPMGAAA